MMTKKLRILIYIISFLALYSFTSPPAVEASENREKETLTIAVSTNALGALTEIVRLYEDAHGSKVDIVAGSSGKLYAQITRGAPFGVFFSADTERPILLKNKGLTKPGSFFIYGKGTLVIWQRNDEPKLEGDVIKNTLTCSDTLRIAIANPETAPYGRAAMEVFKNAEVLEDIEEKLVYGESVGQALSFASTGNAEVAVVALASIKNLDYGTYVEVDRSLYSPIMQGAVTIKGAPKEADYFVNFIKTSEEVRAILIDYGYYGESKE